MYRAQTIADYVVYQSIRTGKFINNIRLQEMLYYIQAAFLLHSDKPCFKDDIYAWGFGPVVPDVYKRYMEYGQSYISEKINKEDIEIKAKDKEVIDKVVSYFKAYKDSELKAVTLEQEPWKQAFDKYGAVIITPAAIKEHYEKEEE